MTSLTTNFLQCDIGDNWQSLGCDKLAKYDNSDIHICIANLIGKMVCHLRVDMIFGNKSWFFFFLILNKKFTFTLRCQFFCCLKICCCFKHWRLCFINMCYARWHMKKEKSKLHYIREIMRLHMYARYIAEPNYERHPIQDGE